MTKYKWFLKGNYAFTPIDGNWVPMSNLIMGWPPEGFVWDHINRNSLDNRRENLRLANSDQNQANRGKSKNNTSGFKNVRFVAKNRYRPWRVKLHRKGTNFQAYYMTAVEAAHAADLLALRFDGNFAYLNFPIDYYVKDDTGNWAMNAKSKRGSFQ